MAKAQRKVTLEGRVRRPIKVGLKRVRPITRAEVLSIVRRDKRMFQRLTEAVKAAGIPTSRLQPGGRPILTLEEQQERALNQALLNGVTLTPRNLRWAWPGSRYEVKLCLYQVILTPEGSLTEAYQTDSVCLTYVGEAWGTVLGGGNDPQDPVPLVYVNYMLPTYHRRGGSTPYLFICEMSGLSEPERALDVYTSTNVQPTISVTSGGTTRVVFLIEVESGATGYGVPLLRLRTHEFLGVITFHYLRVQKV